MKTLKNLLSCNDVVCGSMGGLLLLVLTIFSGCSTPTVKVDPSLLHSSYDYAKPAEIADKSKPVWILPMINKGWVPATVDPKTGDWISGHYTASIIQEGHWATLEEAELAGRPYVVAGESKPVVPLPSTRDQESREVPTTGMVGGEIDLADLNRRVAQLEENRAASPGTDNDALADNSAQLRAFAQNASQSSEVTAPPLAPSGSYQPTVEVESQPDSSPLSVDKSESTGLSLILPASQLARDYEIPVGTSLSGDADKIQVHYLNDRSVQITYHGQTHQIHLHDPSDRVKLTLPPTTSG